MANDRIYKPLLNAFDNADWIITDDPLILSYEEIRGLVDLGVERMIGIERENEQVAVEIKSFIGNSVVQDIERMLGQHTLYQWLLKKSKSERELYIAISDTVYFTVFQGKAVQELVEELKISLVVIDLSTEEIIKWIKM